MTHFWPPAVTLFYPGYLFFLPLLLLLFVKIRSSFSETYRPIAMKFDMVIGSCHSFDPLTSATIIIHVN